MVKTISAAALALVALAAPAGAAERPTTESGRLELVQDRSNLEVFRDVQKQVVQYPNFTIFDIVKAEIDEGVVTLTGKVTMPYKRTDIEKRVAKLAGVSAVTNRIEVLPVSRFDDELRLRIARSIYGSSTFWSYASMANPPIHIIVEGGHVTLEGVVNNEMDRMLARSLASQFGVFSLKNELKTDAEARAELEKL
jgi:hyperosmotically inducible protein